MLAEKSCDQQLSITSEAQNAPIGNKIQYFEILIHPIKLITRQILYDV